MTNSPAMISKTIDGANYTLQLLPTTKGLESFLSALIVFGDSFDGGKLDLNIGRLAYAFKNVDLISWIKGLLSTLSANSEAVDFDEHFPGKYDTLIKVITWASEENFRSFFAGAAALKAKLPSAAVAGVSTTQAPKNQPTS